MELSSNDLLILKNRKKIEVFDLTSDRTHKDLFKIDEDLLKGCYYLNKQFDTVKVENDNIWISDPLNNRSWRFWLHSLIVIQHLVNGYEMLNREAYLNKATELLLDWKKHNFPKSESEMAWHDHSTALRLLVICKYFETWKLHKWDNIIAQEIIELAVFHCEKLTDPKFYREKHNHGLDQDIALYVASIVFHNLKQSKSWEVLSFKRFSAQLDQLFASDGSYLEHSPVYSYILCQRLLNFLDFLKLNHDLHYETLENLISSQLQFIIFLLQPNGIIPPIGDSDLQLLNLKKFNNPPKDCFNNFKYILSRGKMGTAPQVTEKIYHLGGYGVFRNKWKYDKDTVQLIFYSSFHSRVHKHHDDLSITLFGYNQPILIDSGKYNYNYEDPKRRFVVSVKAHNTVVVDDMDTDISKSNIGKSGITDYFISKDFSIASGIHCLYSGIVHKRTIIFIKPWNIIILDEINGYKDHKFEQVFNFHPSVRCKIEEKLITGTINNKFKISLSPLFHKEDIALSLIKGQQTPLKGWCSIEYGKLIPTWSASFIQTGKEAQFATHINLKVPENIIQDFEWNKDLIKITYNENILEIFQKKDEKLISINGRLEKMISIHQPHIEKAIANKIIITSLIPDKKSPCPIGTNILWTCECQGENLSYAWYIYKDNRKVESLGYSKNNCFIWTPKAVGHYNIKVFVKDTNDFKQTMTSTVFSIN